MIIVCRGEYMHEFREERVWEGRQETAKGGGEKKWGGPAFSKTLFLSSQGYSSLVPRP